MRSICTRKQINFTYPGGSICVVCDAYSVRSRGEGREKSWRRKGSSVVTRCVAVLSEGCGSIARVAFMAGVSGFMRS